MLASSIYRGAMEITAALVIAALFALPAMPVSEPHKAVSLYLSVEKGSGLVEGLTANDFRLFEDGKAQAFQLKKPESPITVALLLEYTQNSLMFYDDICEAVNGFLDTAPEGNWYALASFDRDLHIDVDFTQDIGKIRAGLQEIPEPLWSETDTYDAVYHMLDKMSLLPGRRVLIVIGSGFDSFSRHTFEDVQKKVESSNVTIFGVGLGSALRGIYEPYLTQMQEMDVILAGNFLRMLADESGGDSWFPNEESAYPDVMKGVMQTLATQYRLVYSPEVIRDNRLHKVEVQAFQIVDDKRQNFKVRVRKGWRF